MFNIVVVIAGQWLGASAKSNALFFSVQQCCQIIQTCSYSLSSLQTDMMTTERETTRGREGLSKVNNFSVLLSQSCIGNVGSVPCEHWIRSLQVGKYVHSHTSYSVW